MTISLRAITPDKVVDVDRVQRELRRVYRQTGRRLQRELERPTATWNDKPSFGQDITDGGVVVKTSQDKYIWTDWGTRARIRYARRAPTLRFRKGFRAKTRPGSLTASSGRSFGPWRSPKAVRHPGTTARRFSETVAKMETRRGRFARDVQQAIERGVQS